MPTYHLVAWSNPAEGRDDECESWYDEIHIPDMLNVPGFKSAQRFKLLRLARSKEFKQRYLSIYEFEAADEQAAKSIINVINAANLPISDSLDVSAVNLGIYEARSPKVEKK